MIALASEPARQAVQISLHKPSRAQPRSLRGFDVIVKQRSAATEVAVSGAPTIDQLLSTLHVLGIEVADSSGTVLVMDLRELLVVYDRGELVRVGEEVACSFAHLRKLALVVPVARITRISERSAKRNGMNMRVFPAMLLAHEWLKLEH